MSGPNDFKTCPRCGVSRYVKSNSTEASPRSPLPAKDRLCRDCTLTDPGWPDVHVPGYREKRPVPRFYPEEADEVCTALKQICLRVEAYMHAKTRVCPCGCLLAVWEATCPACLVAEHGDPVTHPQQGAA